MTLHGVMYDVTVKEDSGMDINTHLVPMITEEEQAKQDNTNRNVLLI